MRFALEFAVDVVVVSPLTGVLAGYLRVRANRCNLTSANAGSTLTSS